MFIEVHWSSGERVVSRVLFPILSLSLFVGLGPHLSMETGLIGGPILGRCLAEGAAVALCLMASSSTRLGILLISGGDTRFKSFACSGDKNVARKSGFAPFLLLLFPGEDRRRGLL